MKKNIKELISPLLTGLIIAILVFLLGKSRNYELSRCLSDACFVAGAVLLFFGGMSFVKKQGAFDVMGYGLSHSLHNHFPALGYDDADIYAYKERKQASRKSGLNIISAAVIYLVLAAIMLAF